MKTVWSDKAKKWKPRNYQAVAITFKAKGLHVPPPEPSENQHEKRRREQADLKKRAERAKKDLEEHAAAVAAKQREDVLRQKEARKKRSPRCNWVGKHMRQQAKLSRGVIKKPTTEQIREARESAKKSV